MRIKMICLALILALCLFGTGFSQHGSKSNLVGNLSERAPVRGCGCYFRFRGAKDSGNYIFAEGIEYEDGAWMNIDGRDVQLRVVKDWQDRGKELVGSRSSRTFAANNISVTSTYVTTRVCAAADEDCEFHDYDATFVVRKGKRVRRVRAVGSCGC